MNEPKKSEIEGAAKRKWPNLIGSKINQRQHTIDLFFPNAKGTRRVTLQANSHRELLSEIGRAAETL